MFCKCTPSSQNHIATMNGLHAQENICSELAKARHACMSRGGALEPRSIFCYSSYKSSDAANSILLLGAAHSRRT